jgi:hypothetical protein
VILRYCSIDLLAPCQQEPSFGQYEPRPSVLAAFAAVCLAKAFFCFKATVVVFGHLDNDDSESLPIAFSRSAARGLLLTSPPLPAALVRPQRLGAFLRFFVTIITERIGALGPD